MKIFNKTNPLFKFFASLKLAVFSILLLATVLATATFIESYYGMRAVHVLVYGTWWFAGCLLLLGTNVFCAAMIRYPWKPHQTGFAVTHLGILTILAGSFLTQQFGVDGNLPIVEGSQENEVTLNSLELSIVDEKNGTALRYPIREAAHTVNKKWLEVELGKDQTLKVDQYIPRALPKRQFIESPVKGVGAPAIRLELANDRFQISEWVFDQHPGEGAVLNLGPAIVKFKQIWNEEDGKRYLSGKKEEKTRNIAQSPGYIILSLQGREYRIEFSESLNKWHEIPQLSIEVKLLKYLPYAVVEKNELVNRSDEPANPTVQLLVRKKGDTEREPEKHTVFANFPEFTTLHGQHKLGKNVLGVKFRLKMYDNAQQGEMKFVGKNRGELRLAQSVLGDKLFYEVLSPTGEVNSKGEIKVGELISTGWMNIQFKVAEWIPHAVEDESPRSIDYISGSGDNYLSAIHLSPSSGSPGFWLFEGGGQTFSLGGKDYYAHFTKNQLSLPFQIFLEKFTVGMDPGTSKAATYESQVILKDPSNGIEKNVKISMNEPLKYGGYTFYQASYQMEEGKPPVSVLSVNKDIGRWVKYSGSLILCLGILLMFYMNPHYWGVLLGKKKEGTHHA